MRIINLIFLACFSSLAVHASTAYCPDPKTTSLQWGQIPAPWKISPFSENKVQGDENTRFVNAQILVVGGVGRGVVCTYEYSLGNYSIWWETLVRTPARDEWNWMRTSTGYLCSNSIADCAFSVG